MTEIPMTHTRKFGILEIGKLEFIWNLVLGIWDF